MPALFQKVGGEARLPELRPQPGPLLAQAFGSRMPIVKKEDSSAGTRRLVGVEHQRRPIGCVDAIHVVPAMRRRSKSSAACAERARISPRSPGKMRFTARVSDPRLAASHTVPTGLSAVPPLGPAIPVTARPDS